MFVLLTFLTRSEHFYFQESILSILNGQEGLSDSFLERLDNIAIDLDDLINIRRIDSQKKQQIKANISAVKKVHKQLRKTVVEDFQVISLFYSWISFVY